MTWLHPWGWLWLGMAVPLVLLYILRIRRRRYQAPTLLFWEEVFQDSKPRAWWQRFRSLLSLMLQLLLLALLAAAIADPLTAGQSRDRRLWVLLVDRSASMAMPVGSDPTGPSRLEEARRQALQRVRRMREWDQAMVIAFAADAEVLCGRTDNPRRLAAAIRQIRQSDLPAKPEIALRLASSLHAEELQPEIVVFSDLAGAPEQDSPTNVHWHPLGVPVDNIGITHLAGRPADEQRDIQRILIKVLNAGASPREVSVSMRADGTMFESAFFALEPGEEGASIIESTFPRGALLEAVRTGDPDGLAADDRAWLVIPPPISLKVGLVESEPNLFLEQVLQAQALVDWTRMSAEEAQTITNLDLIVYHRLVADPPPGVHALYLNPEQNSPWWSLGSPITNVLVDTAEKASPLLRHLRFDDVLIRRANPIIPNRGGEPILWSFGDPLAAAWRADGQKFAAFGIDITQSDLPLRTAFPILIANVMQWVRPDMNQDPRALKTGDRFEFETQYPRGWLQHPDGTRSQWTAHDGMAAAGPFDQVGLYTILNQDDTEILHTLAVNLCDSVETAAGLRPDPSSPADSTLPISPADKSPLWWWLAAAALTLAVTEWWLHQRRWVE